jgi:hypothetical protein
MRNGELIKRILESKNPALRIVMRQCFNHSLFATVHVKHKGKRILLVWE